MGRFAQVGGTKSAKNFHRLNRRDGLGWFDFRKRY